MALFSYLIYYALLSEAIYSGGVSDLLYFLTPVR